MKRLTFKELQDNKNWKEAVIVFTEDSYSKPFTEIERSYRVHSDAKYFDSTKIGNSLFGDCLDGTDLGVRLDVYIHDIENKWKVEYCYITA